MVKLSPIVTLPPRFTVLLILRLEEVFLTVPPLSVSVPFPKAKLAPAERVPPFRVKPPENVLVPESVREPAPFFVILWAPEIRPLINRVLLA